jgi:hypothetical protein
VLPGTTLSTRPSRTSTSESGCKDGREALLLECFTSAWIGEFGRRAREAARASASAAAVPERLLEPLELAFFGWRIGRRLDNPKFYPTTAGTAVRMLESVARE